MQTGQVGQWIGFGALQLFGDHHLRQALGQAQGVEHVFGIGARSVGHHDHAQAFALGMVEQAQQPGDGRQLRCEVAKACFLAIGKGFMLGHRAIREQVLAHVGVGPATGVQLEFFVGEVAAFLGQQLLDGKQVQGVGFGQSAIEVEQQGFKHESSIPSQGLPQCSSVVRHSDANRVLLGGWGLAII
ncbi:hypothetical protein AO269_16400 [Pseudomonas putida]|nr:hypothetical protein AO269_16400 [Pseudomonas putida]